MAHISGRKIGQEFGLRPAGENFVDRRYDERDDGCLGDGRPRTHKKIFLLVPPFTRDIEPDRCENGNEKSPYARKHNERIQRGASRVFEKPPIEAR